MSRVTVANRQHVAQLDYFHKGFRNLPEAPTLYPSEEEFKDPIVYIQKNRALISSFGIAKIVPPKSWKPPRLFNDKKKFETKKQNIYQLCNRITPHDLFMLLLRKFLTKRDPKKADKLGETWTDLESSEIMISGNAIDLYNLFLEVLSRGGYDQVTSTDNWHQILQSQLILGSVDDRAPKLLQYIYRDYLLELEYEQKRKAGAPQWKKEISETSNVVSQNSSSSTNSCLNTEKMNKKRRLVEEDEHVGLSLKDALIAVVLYFKDTLDDEDDCLICSKRLDHKTDCLTAFCKECDPLNKQKFGFLEGCVVNIEELKEYSEIFRRQWFLARKSRYGICPKEEKLLHEPPYLEAEYWRLVDSSQDAVSVYYGSDLFTNLCGSGFPSFEGREKFMEENVKSSSAREQYDRYLLHPWNLNVLPELGSSLLSCLNVKIPGITIPWLYIGMLFSSFCWHNEDSYMYSLNYMHEGEGKIWYGCSGGTNAALFEASLSLCIPELFDTNPDLLYNMVTTVNPLRLFEKGTTVCRTIQYAGEFIVTMPQAYHAGFSLGYTCAEAVNFACTDWLPFAWAAHSRYIKFSRAPAFTLEELFIGVINSPDFLTKTCSSEAKYLLKYIQKIVNFELSQRNKCFALCPRIVCENKLQSLGECSLCKHGCFFSSLIVLGNEDEVVTFCLHHVKEAASYPSRRELIFSYKYSMEELNLLVSRAQELVRQRQGNQVTQKENGFKKTAIENIVIACSDQKV
ncbi:Lysine-specific demethylase 5B [Galdieria sulphuraria]|uniref:Histone demethylase JARID1 n=1 Tax=Galdieria sulphuraria TaxID=130081 RepID=M2XWZ9_GALSU|nr:histone demethylase JARID1 [Galdieria sulphuraria]EME27939.1 histone demethylase JARID1 [Galdieria sulphuraria]GJD07857.1 Lysine-specific demethylase 5B [Galdieria sulphuraria]|eukprot:XP_005704459.1 histone demethylase JARID1 [Galdieria sulphuraria]